uniref:UDP-glucuronosyltransferase n=1 Tax=Rhabditophanes sp. KR3021 TaxID=114890 RepID=A0AC35TSD9_9BILA
MKLRIFLFSLFVNNVYSIDTLIGDRLGKKVLFYVPTLSFSHVAFNQRIAKSLIDKGFRVTTILPDIDPFVNLNSFNNSKKMRIDVGLNNGLLPQTLWSNPGPFEDSSPLNPRILNKLIEVSKLMTQGCESLVNNKQLIHNLIKENYTLGFVEQYDACGLGLFKAIGITNIHWLSATNIYRIQPEKMGINYPLSYVSELFSPFGDVMTFHERILNLLTGMVTEAVQTYFAKCRVTSIFKDAFPKQMGNINSVLEVASLSRSVISNNLPLLDFPSPTSNILRNVGGITLERKIKKLSTQFESIVSRTNGFWLITFGSIAKTSDMPFNMKYSLFKAFQKFPNQTFILKYEDQIENIKQYSSNVYLVKWLPQLELMSHPKYLGLITHGGWSSMLESLINAKPMILMPLFADHGKNTQIFVTKKLAIAIDKMDVTPQTFTDALNQLITNPVYENNCKRYALMLQHSSPIDSDKQIVHAVQKSLKESKWRGEQIKLVPLENLYYFDFLIVIGIITVCVYQK